MSLPLPPPPSDNQPGLPLDALDFDPWQIVLADPAWSFNDKGSRLAPDSTRPDDQASRSYRTASVREIRAMRPSVASDAALFLWTTWTHILDGSASDVARAWGFTPKVVVPWIKVSVSDRPTTAGYAGHPAVRVLFDASLDPVNGSATRRPLKLRIGGGKYVRGVAEPLIIATRGRMVVPPADRLPGLLITERGMHSEKPTEVYDLIETLYPTSRFPRRLEMFVRGDGALGWSTWGDEATVCERIR